MLNRKIPAGFVALLSIAFITVRILSAESPGPLMFENITHDGTARWVDVDGGLGAYEFEFKSGLNGEWQRYWPSLFWSRMDESEGAVDYQASVPMFFRLKKYPLSSPVPPPIQDSDYYDNGSPNAAKVELGRLLFFDKIISGNRNISCATCHHPLTGTGDQLSLPVGEGGGGLGPTRGTGLEADTVPGRVPRNAPPIFNRGAKEFVRMFHDGRVELNPNAPSGFTSPAKGDLPLGLDNVLAAQAMFPVTSEAEMAGQDGENPIADLAARGDLTELWEALADRLRGIPEYVDRFRESFEDIDQASDISFVHAANAIASFEASAGRFDNTPFDAHLRGEVTALNPDQKRGMILFYGKAQCALCHSGPFLTDHDFHAIAMPQIGPGKGDGPSKREDFGRERVTGNSADRYKFRTPSLRNVAITGPWGHDGAYRDLRKMVLHKLQPMTSLAAYDQHQTVLPARPDLDALDWVVMNDVELVQKLAAANELQAVSLSSEEIDQLIAFLHALTDPNALNMTRMIPMRVPSGLPLAE